jgi:hypothetical protein
MKALSRTFLGIMAGLFLFTACSKEPSNPIERSYSNIDFKKIEAGDQHQLTITKGTAFSIIARGEERDINDLVIRVIDSSLKIEYNRYKSNRKRVYFTIALPSLKGFVLSGQSQATVSGFSETDLVNLVVSGQSACWINMNAPKFKLLASGQSKIEFQGGTATGFEAEASGQSEILAYGLSTVVFAEATATGQSTIKVKVGNSFKANASGQSRIYYQGDPLITQIVSTGDSRIIKE